MNKVELAKAITEKSGYNVSQACAEDMINCFMDTVKEALVSGDKVQLVGFGTFEVANRAARNGKNPKTGEAIVIPACKAPKFKAGKAFKDAVNA